MPWPRGCRSGSCRAAASPDSRSSAGPPRPRRCRCRRSCWNSGSARGRSAPSAGGGRLRRRPRPPGRTPSSSQTAAWLTMVARSRRQLRTRRRPQASCGARAPAGSVSVAPGGPRRTRSAPLAGANQSLRGSSCRWRAPPPPRARSWPRPPPQRRARPACSPRAAAAACCARCLRGAPMRRRGSGSAGGRASGGGPRRSAWRRWRGASLRPGSAARWGAGRGAARGAPGARPSAHSRPRGRVAASRLACPRQTPPPCLFSPPRRAPARRSRCLRDGGCQPSESPRHGWRRSHAHPSAAGTGASAPRGPAGPPCSGPSTS
mmetsp:Transcript_24001/g.71422  ORF Transcript_24001/g.71422 Transcript_24001/m.71422 type:complete len:319 (+) Transcript_24001:506-1462(+)